MATASQWIDQVNAAYPAMARLYDAHEAVRDATNQNFFVCIGGAVSASVTTGKLDIAAGTDFAGFTESNYIAQTALNCCSNADATNDRWGIVEYDPSAGTSSLNLGSVAAHVDDPIMPAVTAGRIVHAWVYIRHGSTVVDTATSSANNNSKIIDARNLKPGPTLGGWCYDANTWTNPNTTVTVSSNTVHTNTFQGSGTLNVTSTTGFPTVGVLNVTHSGTVSHVAYTGTTSTTFTGCWLIGNDVTMSTSDVVRLNGFTIASATDYSAAFPKGAWFRWRESGTTKWQQVASSAFGSSITTVLFPASTDTTAIVAAAPDTNSVAFSLNRKPQGSPGWFTYYPNPIGFSSGNQPTSAYYQWCMDGDTIHLQYREGANGTSNATTKTYLLPWYAATVTNANWSGTSCVIDNSAVKSTSSSAGISATCALIAASGLITMVASTDGSSIGAWTASGGARIVFGSVSYRI